jgi:phosphoribulokinase
MRLLTEVTLDIGLVEMMGMKWVETIFRGVEVLGFGLDGVNDSQADKMKMLRKCILILKSKFEGKFGNFHFDNY